MLSKEIALKNLKATDGNLKKKKSTNKSKLIKLGLDKDFVNSLVDEFWLRHKDALFNTCSYHEKLIVEKLMNELQCMSDELGADLKLTRRHDSVLIFGNYGSEFDIIINDFEYLGKKGWFTEQKEDLVEPEEQEEAEVLVNRYEAPTVDAFGNPYDTDLEIEF